jgi:hypothetical protein
MVGREKPQGLFILDYEERGHSPPQAQGITAHAFSLSRKILSLSHELTSASAEICLILAISSSFRQILRQLPQGAFFV